MLYRICKGKKRNSASCRRPQIQLKTKKKKKKLKNFSTSQNGAHWNGFQTQNTTNPQGIIKGKHKNRIRKTHIGLLLGHRVLKGLNRRLGRWVRQRNGELQSIGEIGDLMGKGKKQRGRWGVEEEKKTVERGKKRYMNSQGAQELTERERRIY